MRRLGKIVLPFIFLVILGGCSSASAELKELPEKQEALTLWTNRSSEFGNSNYSAPEGEAITDLKERFGVELSPSFTELAKLATNEMTKDGYTIPEPEYTIASSTTSLNVRDRILAYNGENIMIYTDITEAYSYLKNSEKVKVYSEVFEMSFWTGEGEYLGKDFSELVKNIGELLAIPEKELTEGLEKIDNSAEYANQLIEVYDSVEAAEKNGSFGQQLVIDLGDDGIPAKITASWFDYRV
ncbi:hypothetical protein [Enterococcus sp. HY326]|uniref:hypothetical protein n=1 Tax=Enterococcus sp. HY326 TaxID=2971265 RepID=UPI00223F9D43|nr:hypothetical protein [Enterococcus sp. HY326]